ncbi:MAG: helix-turn-helix transcriptional regulator [Methanosphaera stadtmanae]|jgi:DNA-binding HxlR family transcriptional regulator|nr:helix-turn-helix transcriptional regulator [Methanosphaera stadtmanae]
MSDEEKILNVWGGPNCPIDATLNLIGRKWVISIIRDMYTGKKHFTEFKENKNNLTNAVLSDTLKFMEENDLLEKKYNDNASRNNTEYYLTDKSRALNKVIYEMVLYGLDTLKCDSDIVDDFPQKMKKSYKNLLEIE